MSIRPAAANESCSVTAATGTSLANAKALFAISCPESTRRDCDLIDNRWQCSSDVVGGRAPDITQSNGLPNGLPNGSPNGLCYSPTASNLSAAKSAFVEHCEGYIRRDCDPIGSGWVCSSGVIGTSAPSVASAPTSEDEELALPSAPEEAEEAEVQITEVTEAPDAIEPDPPVVAESVVEEAPEEAAEETATAEPVTEAPPAEAPDVQATTESTNSTIGRLESRDLLVLHYDNCPDRDDGHAMAAAYSVLDTLGINQFVVANGTCGDGNRHQFADDSTALSRAIWGNTFLDVANARSSSINTAATTWAATLANGGRIWIAEGGPSDFTADVLNQIDRSNPELDLRQVQVVQHAHGRGFNESQSVQIDTIRELATYVTIPNGNIEGNGSAGFAEQSNAFLNAARSSRYAREWNLAFDYLDPSCASPTFFCKLDFSDTVELLYILGDNATGNVSEFASRYLSR